jgi:AcrR family transcriptional regulator
VSTKELPTPDSRAERFPRSADTQSRIIAAARPLFAKHGYHGTTIRAVAAAADIHASMVMRYFESKEGLFAAAAEFDLRMPDFSNVKESELGVALVRQFLDRWEGEGNGEELRALLGVAHTNETARGRLMEIFTCQLEPVVARVAHVADKEQCTALIVTQMLGLAFTRYILRLPPIVNLTRTVLEEQLGATIQHYLSGD